MSAYVSDTFGQANSAVAPGAASSVSTIFVVDGGVHSVRLIIEMSGTAETQLANLRLRVNTVAKVTLPTTPGPAPTVVEIDRLLIPSLATIDVQTIGAATAGAIYTVTVLLTRIA